MSARKPPRRPPKGGNTAKSGGTARSRGAKPSGAKQSGAKLSRPKPSAANRAARPAEPTTPPYERGPLVLGAVPGATPGKWIDTWRERMPEHPLDLIEIAVADQARALDEHRVDVALIRLRPEGDTPNDAENRALANLHVVRLYDEVPVVVVSTESELTLQDEVSTTDLAGAVVLRPDDDVLGPIAIPAATDPHYGQPATTGDAIETIAAGVGLAIVPMSLARLHHRRDVTFRPLPDGPSSPVALAWPRDTDKPLLIETFLGIVRGRSARSSRGSTPT
ncbi:LysR substrate-binding domain-containing protein [uncultured Microbacterium sp.]|uniref:LysR substrate-binding domain-containing protein n=1 Tax=uncultured Microbacterium sp. TaxID=191216 RepID=UPI00260175A2|nr:LysR substrate-binding domain-containing protein [uncultured Microbacterium sp.]